MLLFRPQWPSAVLSCHLGLRGSVSFRYLLVSPWEILNTLSLTWDPLLTLFSYQAREHLSVSFILLDQRTNPKITMLKFLLFFSIDQSLSEENFGLFCTQDQLSFSSHQVLQGKEWKQNGRTLCESSFVHFWNHSFYRQKKSSVPVLSRHLVIRCDILCWYV